MAKPNIDGTPFGAWNVLKDGKWHSITELRAACGGCADRRVRALRTDEWGGLTVELTNDDYIGESLYRLSAKEIANSKALVAAKLNSRIKPGEKPDEVDQQKMIPMSITDRVYLLALLTGDAMLNNPTVAVAWHRVKLGIEVRLRNSLPDKYSRPADLFEDDDT